MILFLIELFCTYLIIQNSTYIHRSYVNIGITFFVLFYLLQTEPAAFLPFSFGVIQTLRCKDEVSR